jgi:hypothetical protein
VYRIIGHPLDGEILPEPAVGELPAQGLLPVVIVLHGVDIHGLVLAAVHLWVTLPVAIQVQPPQLHPASNRLLEDARPHRLTVVNDFLGQRDVDG